MEFVIKNAIVKLGPSFSHTIVCGNVNYGLIKQICDSISPNIKIIKMNANNITINDYNNFFYDIGFWNLFQGNKVLIYQEDSIIFKNNIENFLQYDYIGAPWYLEKMDYPCVGNGGFSLRNPKLMIDILSDTSNFNKYSNSTSKKHTSGVMLDHIAEDSFFSICLFKLRVGNIPDPITATYFSTETIVNAESFGGHQFWYNDKNWTARVNKLIEEYKGMK